MDFSTEAPLGHPSSARPPFRRVNADGGAAMVIICDHASNRIPDEFGDFGIAQSDLTRHIAWDIGAAAISETLAKRFDAPAILCDVSRLVIDCNRQYHDKNLIPAISDGTALPPNQELTATERDRRWRLYHQVYHQAVWEAIERKIVARQQPVIVSIHSMTPALRGVRRPWQIAVCWHDDKRLSVPMLAALRAVPDIVVGDNEPYDLDLAEDYSVPVHAMRRGLKHLQMEFRQDEVADAAGQQRWAQIFGDCLEQVLA